MNGGIFSGMRNHSWLLSNNIDIQLSSSYSLFVRTDSFQFYGNTENLYHNHSQNIFVYIDGYVIPKNIIYDAYSHYRPNELIFRLYSEYGKLFITRIKGSYSIIVIHNNNFYIYSDIFGIKKYFYRFENDIYLISNNLKIITSNMRTIPSPENMAIYALTYHFTGGRTAFKNIYHNQPGEYIEYKKGSFKIKSYRHPDELLKISQRQVEIGEISESLKNAVKETIELSEPVSLSLTGGADTRNLLSIFLSIGVKPHLYTYGNPRSNDCVKASIIANKLGLEHHIHDIQMMPDVFEKNARRIIREGGGLASIHRVHRLLAVEKEKQFASQMFLGTLGGEFIKGVSEDDYIVPAIVYENWEKPSLSFQDLKKYLDSKRLTPIYDVKERLLSYFHMEPFMNGSIVSRKYSSLIDITAHLHDAQDVNLYETIMKQVRTPFLDLDYLETLFASKYIYNNKEIIQNPFLRRIQNPVYGSQFIQATFPSLLKFKYSGEHKPSEVLFNKYIATFLKGIRQKSANKYPPNFALSGWMVDFVKKNLPECKNYPAICQVFDLNRLIRDFENEKHQTNEAYWLKYTNPIMMRFIFEEFCCE